MSYYRGLIIVSPHGDYIKNNSKTEIVKSLNLKNISGKPLLLIQNKVALGIIYLDTPVKIDLETFRKEYNI